MTDRTFQMLGTVTRADMDRAAPLYLLASPDGNEAALARREGERFVSVAGPYTLELIDQLAQGVLAGEPRTCTDPKALKALAIGFSTLSALLRRAAREAEGATPGAVPPAPGEAPHARAGCTPEAHAVPTHESGFACTPCGEGMTP